MVEIILRSAKRIALTMGVRMDLLSRTKGKDQAGLSYTANLIRTDVANWREPPSAGQPCESKHFTYSHWVDRSSAKRELVVTGNETHYTLAVALRGSSLSLFTNGKTLIRGVVAPGTVHICMPRHSTVCLTETPLESLHFHLSTSLLRDFVATTDGTGDPSLTTLVDPVKRHDPALEHTARALMRASEFEFPFCQLYIDGLGVALLARLVHKHSNRSHRGRQEESVLLKARMKRIVDFVDTHLADTITLLDLANIVELSPSYFASTFRRTTGMRPHEYLLQQRVLKAQRLISDTHMQLAEIGLMVGFANQAHLSTVFRRFTGQSPGNWRRLARL